MNNTEYYTELNYENLNAEYWHNYAQQYGDKVLLPICAWNDVGAYMSCHKATVTAYDISAKAMEGNKKSEHQICLCLQNAGKIGFRFDIAPVDFCLYGDFGHFNSIDDIKKSLVCINYHLRNGGGFVIQLGKTSTSQSSIQGFTKELWLNALDECGFEIVAEYKNYEKEPWANDTDNCIIEAIKNVPNYQKYTPKTNIDHLCTPVYRHGKVALYNDFIGLQQPNGGYHQFYRYDICGDGNFVGWVMVKIGYSLSAYYDGQIGFMIDEDKRGNGYATDACIALKPLLKNFGYEYITLTVDENNTSSRRVCEKIGAELVKIVDTPKWQGTYKQGSRKTCIYEWKV